MKEVSTENLEVRRKCPHCHTAVKIKHSRCPVCHWSLHWRKTADNKFINHVQAPMPTTIMMAAFLVASIGQLLLLMTNTQMLAYAPWPTIASYIFGHLLKTSGETVMLYSLIYGLRFEYRQLTWLGLPAMLLLVAYHVMAMFMPFLDHGAFGLPYATFYVICRDLLIAAEVIYMAFGLAIELSYNGQLGYTGLFMFASVALHFTLNVLFRQSGNVAVADMLITAVTVVYFHHLYDRLLDHGDYRNVKV